MIVPASNMRRSSGVRAAPRRRHPIRTLFFLCVVAALCWTVRVYFQIESVASRDDAHAADAIAVFGAAEYEGKPSPVLRARLDHALELYRRGLAPVMIPLGGAGDEEHTEGGVGRDYLIGQGVPQDKIIAETLSGSTLESVLRLAGIARSNHLNTILVVSDGTHLFRIREMCRAQGLEVYTSPREPGKSISEWEHGQRLFHEIASYTLWRMHITSAAME